MPLRIMSGSPNRFTSSTFSIVVWLRFKNRDKLFNQIRIKPGTGTLLDFFEGFLVSDAFRMRPFRYQDSEFIGDGQNTGYKRNILAFQSIRIPGAIKLFMVM